MNVGDEIFFGLVMWAVIGHIVIMFIPKDCPRSYYIETYAEVLFIIALWPLIIIVAILQHFRQKDVNNA
jgi:hypothetical protein